MFKKSGDIAKKAGAQPGHFSSPPGTSSLFASRGRTRWTEDGVRQVLAPLAPPPGAEPRGSGARAINDAGQIVGTDPYIRPPGEDGEGGEYLNRAALWSGDTVTGLPGLSGKNTWANDINSAGLVAGMSNLGIDPDGSDFRAVLWRNGAPENLGTLGGNFSQANAINDAGWIVGRAGDANGVWRAALRRDGVITDISAPEWVSSDAIAISGAGDILGYYFPSWVGSGTVPFLRTGGVTYDLRSLLEPGIAADSLDLETGNEINDAGEFPGLVIGKDGTRRAVLFRPVSPRFAITGFTRDAATGTIALTWESAPGGTYRVKHSADPAGDFTGDIGGVSVPAAGEDAVTTSHTFPDPAPGAARLFLRVERE